MGVPSCAVSVMVLPHMLACEVAVQVEIRSFEKARQQGHDRRNCNV